MVRWAAALVLLTGTSAHAQTVMDGSDRALTSEQIASVRSLMNSTLDDPYGSQLQKLRIVGADKICGSINIRNGYGGLTGFKLFGADLKSKLILLTPPPVVGENEDAVTLEAMEARRAALKAHLAQLKAVVTFCAP